MEEIELLEPKNLEGNICDWNLDLPGEGVLCDLHSIHGWKHGMAYAVITERSVASWCWSL